MLKTVSLPVQAQQLERVLGDYEESFVPTDNEVRKRMSQIREEMETTSKQLAIPPAELAKLLTHCVQESNAENISQPRSDRKGERAAERH